MLLGNFFLSSEYDDSNGDGDDEDDSSSSDSAGNASGSRSVVECKSREKVISSYHLIRNVDEM